MTTTGRLSVNCDCEYINFSDNTPLDAEQGAIFQEISDDALSKGGEVDYGHPFRLGLFYDKFLEGFMYSLVINPIVTYPFFGRYLNLPGNMYSAIASLMNVMWSTKVFWAMLSDSVPLFKKHRISYMALGWAIAAVGFSCCAFLPFPQPYFGVSDDCKQNKSEIINPYTARDALPYTITILLVLLIFGMSNAASAGLSVVYARREPAARRGKTTTYCSIAQTFGIAFISIVASMLLNGGAYGGQFCFSIDYNEFLFGYAIIGILGVINAICFTIEPHTEKKGKKLIVKMKQFWDLMATESFLRVGFFILFETIFRSMRSSSIVKIMGIWINASPFVGGCVGMICIVLVIVTMIVYERCFKSLNWRYVLAACYLLTFPLGFISNCLAIFNIIRNQYVNFLDDVVVAVPRAVAAYIHLQLATEVSVEGNEAFAFALMMTLSNVGGPIATMLSNLLSAPFNVAGDYRYFRDSMDDRLNVFFSVFLGFCCNLLAFVLIFTLMPSQKNHVRTMKTNQNSYKILRTVFFVTSISGMVIANMTNLLAVFPSTSCMIIAAGSGC